MIETRKIYKIMRLIGIVRYRGNRIVTTSRSQIYTRIVIHHGRVIQATMLKASLFQPSPV